MGRRSNKELTKKKGIKRVSTKKKAPKRSYTKTLSKTTKKNVVKKRVVKKKSSIVPKKKIPSKVLSSRDPKYRYRSYKDRWFILKLFEDTILEESYIIIEKEIQEQFGIEADYFIPVYSEEVKEKKVCVTLFDGYVFVKKDEDTTQALPKLNSIYIEGPLTIKDQIQLATCKEINNFKKKLESKIKAMVPKKGQFVIPREGVFKNIEGKVLSVNKKSLIARVLFEKSSRTVEAPINIINLDIA